MTSIGPRADRLSCLSVAAPLAKTFRSLGDPNYRIFAIAQLISSCGSRVQVTALRWLVLEMTNSSFLLGLVSFLGQFPLANVPRDDADIVGEALIGGYREPLYFHGNPFAGSMV